MDIKVKEKEKFIYVHYARESTSDFAPIRSQMFKIIDDYSIPKEKDLIIDFGDSNFLNSPEIGIIASLARELRKVKRNLIILSTPKIENLIKSTSMLSINNLLLGLKHIK